MADDVQVEIETADMAEAILGRALDQMLAAGVDGVDACHAAASMALGMMPAFACRQCLARHYGYMLEVLEDRIAGISGGDAYRQPPTSG